MIQLPNVQKGLKKNKFITSSSVVLYGAGKLGQMMLYIFQQEQQEVICFIDRNPKGVSGLSLPVMGLNQIDKEQNIIVCVGNHTGAICEKLVEQGFKNVAPFYYFFAGQSIPQQMFNNNFDSIYDGDFQVKKELAYLKKKNVCFLDYFEIVVTERCSLKCRDCANLMQYYTEPKDEKYDVICQSLDKVFSAVDGVNTIKVLGGEPLMNTRLCDYLSKIAEYSEPTVIQLVTNGTIPFSDRLCQVLKTDSRFMVSLSDYGEISKNRDNIIQKLEKYQICYALANKAMAWKRAGEIGPKEYADVQLRNKFRDCVFHRFMSLKSGKLYICPFESSADALNAIPQVCIDAIDVLHLDEKQICQQIEKWQDATCFEACKYCSGRECWEEDVSPAIQISEAIPYKKYI